MAAYDDRTPSLTSSESSAASSDLDDNRLRLSLSVGGQHRPLPDVPKQPVDGLHGPQPHPTALHPKPAPHLTALTPTTVVPPRRTDSPASRVSFVTSRERTDSGTSASSRPTRGRTSSTLSFFSLPSGPNLPRLSARALFRNPGVLSAVSQFLPWSDFLSLSSTCRVLRSMPRYPELRDAILGAYVPGYAFCVANGPKLTADEELDITISMQDINLFMISQQVSLHLYPSHALSQLSAFLPSIEQEHRSSQLATLAAAHSRLVLLLHSRAPPAPEPEMPNWGTRAATAGLRELTFPEPLSYSNELHKEEDGSKKPVEKPLPKIERKDVPTSTPTGTTIKRATMTLPRKASKRLSIFGGGQPKVPLPSPRAEPQALKLYSGGWRSASATISANSNSNVWSQSDPEDNNTLRRRRRSSMPLASSTAQSQASHSRASSKHSSPSKRTSLQALHEQSSSPLSLSFRPQPHPLQEVEHPSSRALPPHDILLSTHPLRAPVLRVFHPAPSLTPKVISACEAQLASFNIHPPPGAVVCNLGLVPDDDDRSASAASASQGSGSTGDDTPAWMIWDGRGLVPYAPPTWPAPLPDDPLALPGPFYYAHVSPQMWNPVYTLRIPRLGLLNTSVDDGVGIGGLGGRGRGRRREARMRLDTVPMPVESPHSAKGRAMVRTVVWTAVVPSPLPPSSTNHPRARSYPDIPSGPYPYTDHHEPLEVGLGWRGEWVLQGPGTKEGREMLVEALEGRGGVRMWEAVRERSGMGRVWLRCLS